MTYGCIVRTALEDCEFDVAATNKRLEQFGFNIGSRIIDEFLAVSPGEPCKSFKEVLEKVSTGLKIFLDVESKLVLRSDSEYALIFQENPLDCNVVLSEEHRGLDYSNIYCGVIRGALEAVNLKVRCTFTADKLSSQLNGGNSGYEIKIDLEEVIKKKLIDYDE